MEQKAILLNGGRELDVTLVPGTDEFLAKLLGGAPSKPVIPSLRLVDNAIGQRSVGVFVGSRQIGFLAQPDDQELLATLRACQLNGAVARTRGSLVATMDDPGEVTVKVSLAESDRLLGNPGADATPVGSSVGSNAPELHSGHAEDYPDWPPREPSSAEPTGTTGPDSAAPDTMPGPPIAPQPNPSPETLLSTRSAWVGAVPMPATTPQAGWLGSSQPAGQSPLLGQGEVPSQTTYQPLAGQTGQTGTPGQAPGTGPTASDMASATPADSGSWQDYADRATPSGQSPPTGWTAGAPATPLAPKAEHAGMSDKAKAWIAGGLVVAVLAGAGFALWKTFWASKTYTDPEYGYSFSYPGGWDKMDLTSDIASTALAQADDIPPVDAVVVGDVSEDTWSMPEEFSVAVVGLFDTGVIVSDAMITSAMQETEWELAQMPNLGYGVTFGVVEPPSLTTVGSLKGYTMILNMDAYGMSVFATYCFLFDGSVMYVLGGMCDADAWAKFQKTFDSLVDSFKPGGTRL